MDFWPNHQTPAYYNLVVQTRHRPCAEVTVNGTKNDVIAKPFGGHPAGTGAGAATLDVLHARFGVTNFYSGREALPRMGGTVPISYSSDDAVYWLRRL
jgi:hypothetical protein